MAKHLLPLFKNVYHTCYCEPFSGAAAMLFARPEPAKSEVINDINLDVVTLFRVVANHLDEFVKQYRWALSSREMFRWAQLEHVDMLTDIQRSARFFFLQTQAFGGKVTSQHFGTNTTSGPALNLLRLEEALSAVHLRLARVVIENLPWEECMRRYDRPHTLFFCDPPYWRAEGYGVKFPLDEYARLTEVMRSLQGRAILTINDHPAMRDAFMGFKVRSVSVSYTVGGNAKPKAAKESIVTSW